MKTLFVEAKRKFQNLHFDFQKLPRKIGLLSTIQFLPLVKRAEEELKRNRIQVFKSKTLANETQILGCNVSAADKINDKVDAFLLLSSGRWHGLMLAKFRKPVFICNGEKTERLSEEDIQKFNLKKKSALARFFSEDKIGILVSTKPGQYNLKAALILKEELERKGKKAFLFVADTFNLLELENFGLKIYVNTACPGMFFDSSNIINILEIQDFKENRKV
jgi:2-(3-amino-3-carboxypropyl)histidine synthase